MAGIAQRSGSATHSPSPCFQGLRRRETVLQYGFDWQYLYAMLIGYARFFTGDQDSAAQAAALQAAGCVRILSFKEFFRSYTRLLQNRRQSSFW